MDRSSRMKEWVGYAEKLINLGVPISVTTGDSLDLDRLGIKYFEDTGFDSPLIFTSRDDGKGFNIGVTPDDVFNAVGERVVEVIDVAWQTLDTSKKWTVNDWKSFMSQSSEVRKGLIYNIISLELSATPLAARINGPPVVQELDWVQLYFPESLMQPKCCAERGSSYPQVQKYCLMGTAGSFTDFHIDLGGTSVWYHVVTGLKVFFLIKPTPPNLMKYEKWQKRIMNPQSVHLDFLDVPADEIQVLYIRPGDTALLPSGWIHAVYTPCDSFVFGGNFLHLYAAQTQIDISRLEIRCGIDYKYRFPFFQETYWYTGRALLTQLRQNPKSLTQHAMLHIVSLALYLKQVLKDELQVAINMTIPVETDEQSSSPLSIARDMVIELLARLDVSLGGLLEKQGLIVYPIRRGQHSLCDKLSQLHPYYPIHFTYGKPKAHPKRKACGFCGQKPDSIKKRKLTTTRKSKIIKK